MRKLKLKRLKIASMICSVLLLILYGGLRFGNRRTEEPTPTQVAFEKSNLDVVAFNTHLLPSLAMTFVGKRSEAAYRCSEIAEQLSRYDIVGLSEVFDEKLSSEMIRVFNSEPSRKFYFARSPPPGGVFQFAGSGLLLFSRFPIAKQNHLTFTGGSRFLSTGFQAADGLAAKGAIHARLEIGKTSQLDCFLVHLESFSAAIRKGQIDELAIFLKSNRRIGIPFLLMGDFNVSGPFEEASAGFEEYNELVMAFESEHFEMVDVSLKTRAGSLVEGTSDVFDAAGGERIDYVFFGVPSGASDGKKITSETLRLLDQNVPEGSLSDHAAVWARIQVFSSESKN